MLLLKEVVWKLNLQMEVVEVSNSWGLNSHCLVPMVHHRDHRTLHWSKKLDSQRGCCEGYMTVVVVVVGHKPDAMVDLVKMAVLVLKTDLECPVDYMNAWCL